MNILSRLREIWKDIDNPFFLTENTSLPFNKMLNQYSIDLTSINEGDVVAVIGDFNPKCIYLILNLIDMKTIIVPLTKDTKSQHEYFFENALVDVIIEGDIIKKIKHNKKNNYIEHLRKNKRGGLILFSTGTTGEPKAILHDMMLFMKRFETPRPSLRTINFLLFDHAGGLNTFFHTLFNRGIIYAPNKRNVKDILKICALHNIEVLPTTPTFLRMMLIGGYVPSKIPSSVRIITYGTERMDQPTLDQLCSLLPKVDFRQTYGMTEIGVVRVKSKSRNSLYMKVGGEGIETKIVDGILHIRSQTRMVGYLNSKDPFDKDGWYNTKDMVEEKNGYYKITGRISEVINVGGLKYMASEVEKVVLDFDGVDFAKVVGQSNPITGQHGILIVKLNNNVSKTKEELKLFLKKNLPNHMVPQKIIFKDIKVGHRFKKI